MPIIQYLGQKQIHQMHLFCLATAFLRGRSVHRNGEEQYKISYGRDIVGVARAANKKVSGRIEETELDEESKVCDNGFEEGRSLLLEFGNGLPERRPQRIP
jgi:hypothetical protein